ncbi:MAG: CvpA family protein [Candidatus Omnitrophica bacterium]|nr:CvpA family protein [Candidatus Omnitrophota bacterium]
MQNLVELTRHFNWVDILVFLIFLRLVFVSLKEGLAVEFFKIIGALCAVYLALHYYYSIAGFVNVRSGSKTPPGQFLQIAAFCVLCTCGYGFFVLLRIVVFRFITAQINPVLSRWAGLCAGLVRSFLVSSMILFCLLLVRQAYFINSVHYSLSGSSIVYVAPTTYAWIWETFVSKFASREKSNAQVEETLQFEPRKNKR